MDKILNQNCRWLICGVLSQYQATQKGWDNVSSVRYRPVRCQCKEVIIEQAHKPTGTLQKDALKAGVNEFLSTGGTIVSCTTPCTTPCHSPSQGQQRIFLFPGLASLSSPPPPTTSRVLMYCNDGSGYRSPTEITNSQWGEAGLCHLPSLSKYMYTMVPAGHGGT